MSSRESSGSCAERIARATALIRALTGVVDAAVTGDAGGIRSVLLVVEPTVSAWEVTRNLQSALLASLGLSIDTAIVEVRRPQAGEAPLSQPEAPAPPAKASPVAGMNGKAAKDRAPKPAPPAVVHDGNGASRPATNGTGKANGNGKRAPSVAGPIPLPAAKRPAGSVARLEMESRLSGRIGCRVVVAMPDRIAAGESEGADTPAGRIEAAARAVVAASPVAGVDLDGARLVEVAGKQYVIAAVRFWSGRELVYRAEVAAVSASAEAAAAQAALGAILQ